MSATKKPQAELEPDTTVEAEEQVGEIQEEEQEVPKEWEKIVPDACYRSVDEVYDFERILGSGAFSDVVLGRHNATGQEYAIKIIEKAKVCDTEQRKKRVLTEIGILRQCTHENILKLHEIYETALDISIVLDLMDGGELFDLIVQEGRLAEKDANRLAKQMLSALDYLHDQGICHRDLKPENMLCTSKDASTANIRITDFGLAKFGKDCLETPCGTVSYVAPEIVANELYDNSVDIWALGCVLYFMLFGRPPFYGDDEEAIMDQVEEGTYTFPSDVKISDAAKDFLSHLLEKDPHARFTTKQALRHQWILTGGQETARADEKKAAEEAPGAEKGGSGQMNLNLSKEKRENLKSSVNRAIDVQRDGVFLKPAAECTIALRRGVAGKPLKLDLDFEF